MRTSPLAGMQEAVTRFFAVWDPPAWSWNGIAPAGSLPKRKGLGKMRPCEVGGCIGRGTVCNLGVGWVVLAVSLFVAVSLRGDSVTPVLPLAPVK